MNLANSMSMDWLLPHSHGQHCRVITAILYAVIVTPLPNVDSQQFVKRRGMLITTLNVDLITQADQDAQHLTQAKPVQQIRWSRS